MSVTAAYLDLGTVATENNQSGLLPLADDQLLIFATDAHRGLQITTAAFNYLSQDMIDAMDAHRIPIGAQNYLLSLLAPMEPEIVTANGPLG
ncbi:hypothetical protein [Acidithiobacillus sp. AMEEHan]|uniref:hypothetical protein n=1 Tax=Acidithiobacillus sp. AMEEHan TaxID=2994951 RepID=UPI0027E435A7|nr:hypothetical protein [Acidithiobacillus sp. AMEEHan]